MPPGLEILVHPSSCGETELVHHFQVVYPRCLGSFAMDLLNETSVGKEQGVGIFILGFFPPLFIYLFIYLFIFN